MKQAQKGLFYTLFFSVLITFPLFDSFTTMVKDAKIISQLEHSIFIVEDKEITLQNVSLARDHKVEVIRCELLTYKRLNNRQIRKLKSKIEEKVGKKVELETLMRIRF